MKAAYRHKWKLWREDRRNPAQSTKHKALRQERQHGYSIALLYQPRAVCGLSGFQLHESRQLELRNGSCDSAADTDAADGTVLELL